MTACGGNGVERHRVALKSAQQQSAHRASAWRRKRRIGVPQAQADISWRRMVGGIMAAQHVNRIGGFARRHHGARA